MLRLQGVNTALPPITLQHVGHRWYQPDIARFVQRDQLGIRGGLNVYAYVGCNPCVFIDPSGEMPIWIAKPLIFVTGGRESWLDDPYEVAKKRRTFAKIAAVCIIVASGGAAGVPLPAIGIGVGAGVVDF